MGILAPSHDLAANDLVHVARTQRDFSDMSGQ